jgi:hypothetical protein
MQSLDPETVFALTPEGHDVLQHRSLQLPLELRFLMMLINGERSVQTLRLVSPAAKHDDAGFIILLEYQLIRDVNANAEVPVFSETPVVEQAAIFPTPDMTTVIKRAPLPEPPIAEESVVFSSQETLAPDTSAFAPSIEPAFVIEPEPLAEASTVVEPTLNAELSPALNHALVTAEDRSVVEQILKRALKNDAKFALDQLEQKHSYADFLPAIMRLEKALRKNISSIEADALRQRFPEAFSP